MGNFIKNFLKEEDGLGTVEIVVIIAVLVGLAIIFRKAIVGFVNTILNSIVGNNTTEQFDPSNISTMTK